MSLEHLTIKIEYNIVNKGTFKIEGDIKKEKYIDIINNFLSTQAVKETDKRKTNKQEIYTISIDWCPYTDKFIWESDTGNNRLRDDILRDVIRKIDTPYNKSKD
jgi:hypothetical protein